MESLPEKQEIQKKYLFDVNNEDFYQYLIPKTRTLKRLTEMAELGMEQIGIASFGIRGVVGALYIEKVWHYSDKEFKDYIDWAKSLIDKNK